MAYSIYADISQAGGGPTTILPFLLLGVALLIALGFEFVNGFHDTANAVATVIYTHSLARQCRRRLVGLLEPARRAGVERRGRLRHRVAAAGRADPAGRLERRLRHGVRAADCGDHLEPRHLVARPAGLELAHADRLDHRRRRHQCADARPGRHRRASTGTRSPRSARRCCSRRCSASSSSALLLLVMKARGSQRRALYKAPEGDAAAAALDPRPAGADLHAGVVLPRLQRRPEGHGPDHADPDRRRADRLCAEPRDAGPSHAAQFVAASQTRRRRSSTPRRPATTSSATRGPPSPTTSTRTRSAKAPIPSLAALVKQIAEQVKDYGSVAKMPLDKVAERPQRHVSRLGGDPVPDARTRRAN